MARVDPRVDRFMRSKMYRDGKPLFDTDKAGQPTGFEQSVGTDGTVSFTFLNNGEPITYEIQPNRQPRPTAGYAKRTVDTLTAGKSDAPTTPATANNSGPKGERQRKPTSSDDVTQPSGEGAAPAPAPTNSGGGEQTATYFEQYIRLARHLIEG